MLSSIFNHKLRDESKTNAFSTQLKKLCRNIPLINSKVFANCQTPETRAVSSFRVAHQRESQKRRRYSGRTRLRTTRCKSTYRLLENLRRSSPVSKIALRYLQELIYYASLYTALLEQNTFKEYRANWLEALGNLAQYCVVIAATIPTHTRTTSPLITATLTNGLRSSPVESTISLSCTLSTTGSERHPARPDSLTPSMGCRSRAGGSRTRKGPLVEDRA